VPVFRKIELPVPGIDRLHAEARAEGFDFLDTLVDEFTSGENRYDAAGEVLLGGIDDGVLIAVGGLNRDPYLDDPAVGRIRRVYVRADFRNQHVGSTLLTALLDHARGHFSAVRLRAVTSGAARLYERLGFVPIDDPNATHLLTFESARATSQPDKLSPNQHEAR